MKADCELDMRKILLRLNHTVTFSVFCMNNAVRARMYNCTGQEDDDDSLYLRAARAYCTY